MFGSEESLGREWWPLRNWNGRKWVKMGIDGVRSGARIPPFPQSMRTFATGQWDCNSCFQSVCWSCLMVDADWVMAIRNQLIILHCFLEPFHVK